MANYIFLMNLDNTTLTEWDESVFVKMTIVGCGLSFVGCMLTLVLVCFLPIRSDGMFILTNLCVSLIAAQLSLIGAENTFPRQMLCKMATAVLHYLFLVVNFTSLSFGLHLLSKLCLSLLNRTIKRVWIVGLCWGVPLFIVAVTGALRGDTFATSKLCWLSEEHGTRWAFLGPLLLTQIINWIVFVTILITRFKVDSRKSISMRQIIRHQITTACSLAPTLGLTWSFGFSATFKCGRTPQYIFVLLTSIQGILIFLGHMLPNKNVRGSLCQRMRPSEVLDSMTDELTDTFTKTSMVVDEQFLSKRGSSGSIGVRSRRSSSIYSPEGGATLLVPSDAMIKHRVPRHSS